MAWNDIPDRKCVTFNDVAGSLITLKAGESHVNSNRNITKSELIVKYNANETPLSVLAINQLVPRVLIEEILDCTIGTINAIDIPLIQYSSSRSGSFTKNTCNLHQYSDPIVFSKTYYSTVSQQDAINLADTNFPIDGQNNANYYGICYNYTYQHYPNPMYRASCHVLNLGKLKGSTPAGPVAYSLFPNMFFRVYAQNGTTYFESTGVYVPWDGKTNTGVNLASGSYNIKFIFNDGSGIEYTKVLVLYQGNCIIIG
jgi:hypothetical protein